MLENPVKSIYLGVGSNSGNKRKYIEQAKLRLLQNNIKIKKDISIVTFSGTIPETFDVNPSITSIDMDHKKAGLLAAELLVKKINNKDYKKLNYIKPNFIIGGSA